MQTDRPAADRTTVEHVLELVPASHFLLTSAFGELRSGVIVRCVQQVAMHPPMLLVAMEKGQALSPVIRDSRNFALCVLARDDRMMLRTFARAPDQGSDPFLSIPHLVAPGGAPVPLRARGFIACELIRHLDIEADYEVYIGMVHSARLLEDSAKSARGATKTGARSGAARAHLAARAHTPKTAGLRGHEAKKTRRAS
jgi:flavin reductase (DIM6/NTAB) family NADH-FMN oxidoreductase RutF